MRWNSDYAAGPNALESPDCNWLILQSAAGTDLGNHCRIDGRDPLLARHCPSDLGIHQGDDHGECFRVKSGKFSAPEFAVLIGERSQDTRKQAALGECRILLDLFDRRVQRVPNKRHPTVRSTSQFFQKADNRQLFDAQGGGSHTRRPRETRLLIVNNAVVPSTSPGRTRIAMYIC